MNLPEQIYLDFQEQIPALKDALLTGATYATELGHRIINYDIAVNSVKLFFFACMVIIPFIFLPKVLRGLKQWNSKISECNKGAPYMLLLFYLLPLILIGFVYGYLELIIKAIFVPELRLIEILQGLL